MIRKAKTLSSGGGYTNADKKNPLKLGLKAEEEACRYLTEQGYRVIARNFRSRYGELDIVALDGDTLVFVEVRYRRQGSLVSPQESIDRAKVAKIKFAIRDFLGRYAPIKDGASRNIRVDLCAISGSRAGDQERYKREEEERSLVLKFHLIKDIMEF